MLYTQTPAGQTTGSGRDTMTTGFAFTRPSNSKPFNAAVENGSNFSTSPTDSEWATATPTTMSDLTQATNLHFSPFLTWASTLPNGPHLTRVINQPAVLHLINENIYISIQFTAWKMQGAGFAYNRSTPAAVQPAPTVSVSSPANNAVFSSPANVHLAATASVATGTVTNVAFLNGDAQLASVTTSPFTTTANNLAAGAYALRAVATAGGVSSTSAVVNFSVINPVAVATSTPGVTNGQFSFSFSANPGLTYVVQNSSNLLNWIPLVTNTPSGSTVQVNDTFDTNNTRFYRVARMPNP
jgi:hypothetical protein